MSLKSHINLLILTLLGPTDILCQPMQRFTRNLHAVNRSYSNSYKRPPQGQYVPQMNHGQTGPLHAPFIVAPGSATPFNRNGYHNQSVRLPPKPFERTSRMHNSHLFKPNPSKGQSDRDINKLAPLRTPFHSYPSYGSLNRGPGVSSYIPWQNPVAHGLGYPTYRNIDVENMPNSMASRRNHSFRQPNRVYVQENTSNPYIGHQTHEMPTQRGIESLDEFLSHNNDSKTSMGKTDPVARWLDTNFIPDESNHHLIPIARSSDLLERQRGTKNRMTHSTTQGPEERSAARAVKVDEKTGIVDSPATHLNESKLGRPNNLLRNSRP